MLRIVFHPLAQKDYNRLPREFRERVRDSIDELEKLNHPLEHKGVVKLQGRRSQDYRLRCGNYRVKFSMGEEKLVLITRIQHRQAGY